MSDLSVWLANHQDGLKAFAGPVATIIASVAAACVAVALARSQTKNATAQTEIAKLNWQTQHDKIVLDLFDRRYPVYLEIRNAIGEVYSSGAAPMPTYNRYTTGVDQARFLFGPEVFDFLEKMRRTLGDLEVANITIKQPTHPDFNKWVVKRSELFQEVSDFYENFDRKVAPYLAAHQKLLGTN
jgi:hypothetical protein